MVRPKKFSRPTKQVGVIIQKWILIHPDIAHILANHQFSEFINELLENHIQQGGGKRPQTPIDANLAAKKKQDRERYERLKNSRRRRLARNPDK